ncbi:unnamed protein product, partial [Rangifer tarandus platyrhynchus]
FSHKKMLCFRSPAQVGCMRQVLGPGALGRPRGMGLPFPSPEDLHDPGIEPASPVLAGRFFTPEPPKKPNDLNRIFQRRHANGQLLYEERSTSLIIKE